MKFSSATVVPFLTPLLLLATATVACAEDPQAASATVAPQFGWLNWAVLIAYLGAMVGIGGYFSRGESSSEDFFLAGGRIPWWAAGLSIYGTQLSAITFMAVPAIAFTPDGNWTKIVGGWTTLLLAPLVIRFYLPLFRRLKVQTAYEYLERRFHVAVRLIASLIFIAFQVGRMGIVLLLPAAAISATTGCNLLAAVILMGVLATTYTVLGGIEAVIWTDVVQVIVLIGGALLCLIVSLLEIGGPVQLFDIAAESNKLTMFHWSTDPGQPSTWVLVVGFFFINLIAYTTDQTVVQRYLTTRDESAAARSIWLNGLMTIPTGVLFLLLGTALWGFYQTHPDATAPAQVDQAVPWFVMHQLPAGIAGLVIAAIFAAAMSSLDSSMNSIASAVVNDFWLRLRGPAKPETEIRVARGLTLLIGVLGTSMALTMAVSQITSLFDYFNLMLGMLGGGLSGLFLLAIFTTRGHWIGALVGLAAGAAATAVVQLDSTLHVYLAGAAGTLTCFLVGYLVSRLVPSPQRDLTGLTIYTLTPLDAQNALEQEHSQPSPTPSFDSSVG
ncbi:sodium:solute symporter [Blastopirellula sp. JC732]|uniref:Sodium:solute symporter n=1 Tax=Blastopirellula sediminis TaxID=2894196 RepID=A0A9X1MR61_9BACT|nr:sodium:solute symporter [Blastopirellula sediminis]MCC9605551.1 sodium:solute symporter [Blastopirellula sediminis]MCC9631149.1 sodium:solute symporter [Blastopirellula sediminis]